MLIFEFALALHQDTHLAVHRWNLLSLLAMMWNFFGRDLNGDDSESRSCCSPKSLDDDDVLSFDVHCSCELNYGSEHIFHALLSSVNDIIMTS